ncbi:glycosyltransferase family 4 protein [Clostridium gasigenes]|uniref:glycosyltransferase family 4 protein n=1 Tax=Clostridium gasigenes TaxID=94869 RepID=UPI001C0DA58C|nr:glycosyltransferase family 1 protein [Clostridium gasigenes]MBU3103152.1 glycosyltransferase family 4 protein [Clostridium gasigenes]
MIIFNALQTTLSGGIGRYCYELSKELYLICNDIKIVIREEDKDLFSFAKNKDLIIIKGISSGAKRNVFEQFKLPFIIKKKYPNAVIHYPDSMSPLLAKNKCIITVHDIAFRALKDVFTWKTKIWKNISTTLSVKKANRIISISEYTKCELEKYYGKSVKGKVDVVLNGFNDFSNEPIDESVIRDNILRLKNEKYILTVSTISPRKNIDGLIKAYDKLEDKKDTKLVVAGAYGWLYNDVLNLVEQLKLKEYVIFTGKINDNELKYLYSNCELFAYLSFYEGFGLPPLEAMSYGKKCIVSDTSSIPEVVGDAAIKINPYNIEEISYSIDNVLNKNDMKLSSDKIKKNIERFSWEKCAEGTIKVYKNILNKDCTK